MRCFVLLIAILAALAPAAYAGPIAQAAVAARPPPAVMPVHSCHSEPFFDAWGRLHVHVGPDCRSEAATTLRGQQTCGRIARSCSARCSKVVRRRGRCLMRCYRRNAPTYC